MVDTARIKLRNCRLSDDHFIMALFRQPECLRFIGDKGIIDTATARDYIQTSIISSYENYGFGLMVMELKSTGESIGLCGLVQRQYLPIPDLGFALLKRHSGNGYCLEAASAFLAFCENHLQLAQVLAITNPDNERSINLLQKLDFDFTSAYSDIEEIKNINTYCRNLKLDATEVDIIAI